ncbi:helix-turn-helix domain-containing protein [Blastococcus xanthinilyticus]|uniref:Excisionase family DNA binding protein n=1 Tax=Blastococcus xanthinilyticus TaxID=1564164 RepID=A0A5S5CLG4_9ACTN|nr:helix-turn-helix domain-containing protein [Blastococcus xanthinilyticus]TYP82027.1 excisionase family DNA binding protein [Blastococcus xanthinilyticus]
MSNLAANEEDILTTAQVAELTGWSVTSINRWAAAGVLPATKLPGRTGPYLFTRGAVAERLRGRATTASAS